MVNGKEGTASSSATQPIDLLAKSSTSDEINPDVESKKNSVFRLDPAFPVTFLSMAVNFTLGNMVVYGITARPKLAYIFGLLTMPPTLYYCLRDAQADFENWEKTRRYRERNFPKQMLPYKVRYDWSDYQDVILSNRERKAAAEREANEGEFEREQL